MVTVPDIDEQIEALTKRVARLEGKHARLGDDIADVNRDLAALEASRPVAVKLPGL